MLLARSSGLLILLLAGRAGFSQKITPGYIVTAGQDSLRGAIVIHEEAAQQKQVDFITARGNQRQRLDAYQLKAYGYTTEQDTVRYIAVSMNLGRDGGKTERLFLRQLLAGPAELYQYRYSRDYFAQPSRIATEVSRTPNLTIPVNTAHPPVAVSRFTPVPASLLVFPPLSATSARAGTGISLLLRRHGQPGFTETTWWNFPTDAMTYFADCPALALDLQAKRYHARDLPQLVRRYNSCQGAPAH
ncbi:hypothetical protein [Hymenobacter sp. UYCo722]|uniref:hypothetical protein n=1 Tax=Hymenobacter sp. UYCo722 TaxID=3156335 RepID=UPI00339B1455